MRNQQLRVNHVSSSAEDRWGTRRSRALEFMRENGVIGLAAKIRRLGLLSSLKFVKYHLRFSICIFFGRLWDHRHCVNTGGLIELTNLEVVGPNRKNAHAAVSTSPRTFVFLSRFFPAD